MARKYELDDLLRVREIRKDRAEKVLHEAQQLVREAEQAIVKAQQELEDYKLFVIQESQRLYDQVMRKSINKREIDNLNFLIKELQNKIFDYMKRVEDAILACDKAKEHLEESRKALREAERNIDKIETMKDVWREQVRIEEERAADAEMEDLPAKRR
ncbi:MAG: type III secretion protein [Verrucomicrobiota bacterium]|nr:type III secretion protein [Opitutales bacterium]UPA28661.1 MAG: type III secretion protein [Verrucomicrobiota bacterium]